MTKLLSIIYPGYGYGEACFPKDVMPINMLIKMDIAELISSVEKVNNKQKNILFKKIIDDLV